MGKELHLLRIDVVDGENIDHGRWDDAFVDIGYEGGRRRTKLARVQKGRAMFLSPIEFGMSTPPTCMMAVRIILDSPVLGTKERCKTAVSLDDVVVSGTKHNLRVVVDPVKRTTVNLAVWVAKPGEKDPPMAIAQPRRTGGNFTITVGTQTIESRVHSVAVPRSTFASFPTAEEAAAQEGHGPDVGSPTSLKPTRDTPGLTVRPEYASTLDHASGVAMDIELVKRLAAAWPVDQVEGLLVYCQRLKEEKADLEKAALRQTMLSARTATSELRRRPSPPKQRGGPAGGAANWSGVREAGEPRLLEPAFPTAADTDADETFAKLALVHGQPLSNAEREHVSRHYDTL